MCAMQSISHTFQRHRRPCPGRSARGGSLSRDGLRRPSPVAPVHAAAPPEEQEGLGSGGSEGPCYSDRRSHSNSKRHAHVAAPVSAARWKGPARALQERQVPQRQRDQQQQQQQQQRNCCPGEPSSARRWPVPPKDICPGASSRNGLAARPRASPAASAGIAGASAMRIGDAIKAANSLLDLELILKRAEPLNVFGLAALLARLPKAARELTADAPLAQEAPAARPGRRRGEASAESPALAALLARLSPLVTSSLAYFTPRQLGSALWALAKLAQGSKGPHVAATTGMAAQLVAHIRSSPGSLLKGASTQTLVTALYSLALLGAPEPDLVPLVAAGIVSNGPQVLSEQDIANSLWAMATLGSLHEPLADMLCKATLSLLQGRRLCSPAPRDVLQPEAAGRRPSDSSCTSTIHLGGTESSGEPHGSPHLRGRAAEQRQSIQGEAEAAHGGPLLRPSSAYVVPPPTSPFTGQGLANILWALAKTRWPDRPDGLTLSLLQVCLRRLLEFDARTLSILCCAVVRLDSSAAIAGAARQLLVAAGPRLERIIPSCSPVGVTSLLWAHAHVGHAAPGLLEAAATAVLKDPSAYKPQLLSQVVWSFSKLECFNLPVYQACIDVLKKGLGELDKKEVTMALWAYGRLHASFAASAMAADPPADAPDVDLGFVQLMLARLKRSSVPLNFVEVASAAVSLTLLKFKDKEMEQLIVSAALEWGQRMQPSQAACVAWFVGKFCVNDDRGCALVFGWVDAADSWTFSELGLLAWSLSITAPSDSATLARVLSVMSSQFERLEREGRLELAKGDDTAALLRESRELQLDVVKSIEAKAEWHSDAQQGWSESDSRRGGEEQGRPPPLLDCLPEISLCQAMQAFMVMTELGNASQELVQQLASRGLYSAARSVWRSRVASFTCSAAQTKVLKALECMPGVEQAVLEWQTPDGMFSVDIMVDYKGRRVAVEVQGPSHFAINDKTCELGESGMRRMLLQARGLLLLPIATELVNGCETEQALGDLLQQRLLLLLASS